MFYNYLRLPDLYENQLLSLELWEHDRQLSLTKTQDLHVHGQVEYSKATNRLLDSTEKTENKIAYYN